MSRVHASSLLGDYTLSFYMLHPVLLLDWFSYLWSGHKPHAIDIISESRYSRLVATESHHDVAIIHVKDVNGPIIVPNSQVALVRAFCQWSHFMLLAFELGYLQSRALGKWQKSGFSYSTFWTWWFCWKYFLHATSQPGLLYRFLAFYFPEQLYSLSILSFMIYILCTQVKVLTPHLVFSIKRTPVQFRKSNGNKTMNPLESGYRWIQSFSDDLQPTIILVLYMPMVMENSTGKNLELTHMTTIKYT